ncbi:uncharacterized protein METZ01_LOCUS132362 [marine metagenome]|uniref:Uncharacterized protein n=1 Tax=marine metagenome TaxID=408172 RepID=A0A381YR63_9ZZZZ
MITHALVCTNILTKPPILAILNYRSSVLEECFLP